MSAEVKEFRAEMKQLMDIIIHSLYTNREVFLRELISNAADAIDRVRFEGLTKAEVLEDNADWKIKIIPDEKAATLTVSDNGVGMSYDSVVDQLGSVAKSGTSEFLENLKQANATQRPELIGRFGVGFYSSFMVADKVTVISRAAGDPKAGVKWESDGKGSYSIETVEKEKRGTDVILRLRDDAKEFLNQWTLRSIVRKFSDFVEHPIVMDVEQEKDGEKQTKEETLNSQKALWLRAKSEISNDEAVDFYKHLTRDMDEPSKVIHFIAEGNLEFRALLFLPSKKPPTFMMHDPTKQGPHLYVKRVFITDNAEALLPPYLRFVRGVVEAADLPLNVSRETLQDNPMIAQIQKSLVNRILKALEEFATEEPEKYAEFFKAWGTMLKMGVYSDWSNREKLAELLRYESTLTKPDEFTSLPSYVTGMKTDQKEIYYLLGPDRASIENSPYLELFKDRGFEVLLMTEPVDEWAVADLREYKEKPLKAVDKGELDVDKDAAEKKKESEEQFKDFLGFVKDKIPQVKDVRLSARLKDSAAVLVAEEGDMSPQMQAILKGLGQKNVPQIERTLELNPDHPSVKAVRELYAKDAKDPRLEAYARLFYDQAVLLEGSKIDDPAALAKRINELIVKNLGI